MNCEHCGSMCGHGVYFFDGALFCSDECVRRYDQSQTELSKGDQYT